MPDVQEVFRLATQDVRPEPGALERQLRGQRRRALRRKVGGYAAVAALVLVAATAFVVGLITGNQERPAHKPTPTPTAGSQGHNPLHAVIVGLDGSIQGRVPGLPNDAWSPSLSPDGTQIVFVNAVRRVGIIGIDGTGLRYLDVPGVDERPVWSPDGTQIALQVTRGPAGNTDIYVVRADGTDLRRLTTSPADDVWPAWSSDGSTIIYANAGKVGSFDGSDNSPTSRIYAVPVSGGTPTLVSSPKGVSDPTYSPDGTRIAFRKHGIWVMDADGTNVRRLAGPGSYSPRWSPDGTKIAFSHFDASWRADIPTEGTGLPVLQVRYVDVRSGHVHALKGLELVTNHNTPQWLPSNDALLILRVQRP